MKHLGVTIFILILGAVVVSVVAFGVQKRITSADRFSLHKYTVEDARGRRAVCNDGSPAVYYYRPAEVGYEDKWVVWFEGGGGCVDEASCLQRRQTQLELTTSKGAKEERRSGGILSIEPQANPDFFGWNHVILNYCSSDNWTGQAQRSVKGHPWFFEGKHIVQAVFEDLSNEKLIGTHNLSTAEDVVVTGTSAGGGGVAQNLNDIVSWLPGAAVVGVIDSSWEVPGPSLTMTVEELQTYSDQVIEYRGSQLDAACLQEAGDHPSDCQYISQVYPYLSVPTFIYIDQYDQVKLEGRFGFSKASTPEERSLIQEHAQSIRDSLEGLDGVFSPQEGLHGALTDSRFTRVTIDGFHFQEVLRNWYFGVEGPTALIAPAK